MSKSGKKIVIGIIGGMGSGKSTVAGEFGKLGCGVIDGDKVSHHLLEEDSVKKTIVECFGEAILNSDGRIGRKKLAKIAFDDKDKLASLNKIIHPLVLQRTEALIYQYNQLSNLRAIVLDMPLLVEVGLEKICDFIVFVECKSELRAKRLGKFRDFDEKEVKNRENFQFSLDIKSKLADNIIDNNSGFSALARQVAEIFSQFVGV